MTIRTKILFPMMLLLVVCVFVFSYALVFFSASQRRLELEVAHVSRINDLSMQIAVLRQQSLNSVLTYRINADPAYLHVLEHLTANIDTMLEEIRLLTTTDMGRALLSDFEQTSDDLANDRALLINTIKAGNADEVERRYQIWYIKAENNYASLLDFISYHQELARNAYSFYEDLVNNIYIFLASLSVLLVVLIITFYFYLRNIITRPLRRLTRIAQNISEGDFSYRYDIRSRDEIGILAQKLKIMAGKLSAHQKSLREDVKRKEEELARLKEFDAQKDNFLSVASHELKTPVTSLKLLDQLLKRKVAKNRDTHYAVYLDKMDEQLDKLTRLIVSLLEIAKMQIGKIPFHMAPFDLMKVIHDEVYIAQRKTKQHTVELQGSLDREVYGDRDRIIQVLDNLISNAIKYSDKGKILISVGKTKNGHAVVGVRDFGIGIDKRHHKKIFSRFYRVSSSRQDTYSGLGIGLYISAEIIRKHKGELWVESAKGKGSVFRFTLPLA